MHPPREYGSVITPTSITVHMMSDGAVMTWTNDHPMFNEVVTLLKAKAPADDMRMIMDVKTQVTEAIAGWPGFKIEGNEVTYNGRQIPSRLAKAILTLRETGMGVERLLNFYKKLDENQFYGAYEGLYDFIEKTHVPLTEDGNILLFKAVRDDFKDWHSGTFDNSPGKVVEILPREVEMDRHRGCASGLHAAGRNYVGKAYGGYNGRLIMVEIDPRHVVSVPYDYNCEKMRVYKYTVVCEIKDGDTMKRFDNVAGVNRGQAIDGVTWATDDDEAMDEDDCGEYCDDCDCDVDDDDICLDCGKPLPDKASFCPNCGHAT
jgi:hypothetical protein